MKKDLFTLPPPPFRFRPSMKGRKRLYVLGADDPEMEAVKNYLDSNGCAYVFATYYGARVNPDTAYLCDPVPCEDGVTLTLVECEPRDFLPGKYVPQVVDHHPRINPGTLGNGTGCNLRPSDYLHGSSLGQISFLEGVPLSEDEMYVPAQAVHGFCPGIDPERARLKYLESTMRRQKVTLDDIKTCMRDVGKDVAKAASSLVGDEWVADMSSIPTGNGYTLRYISSIAYAVDAGIPVLLSNRNGPEEPEKRVLTGLVTPSLVLAFTGEYAAKFKLKRLWCDDNRGAGGLLLA
jgi:hypothetical protein